MKRRGPDSQGHYKNNYYNKDVVLLHSRLNIIDLNSHSNQPFYDKDFVLVFNGEIYNYRELRQELGTENFQTSTDSEVILLGYEKWGEKVLDHLIGMFAFAIWDPQERRLFAARDRFGIKPFYFTSSSGVFRFASEAKALLPFLPTIDFSENGLSDYLTLQLPLAQTTLFKGIEQLQPAHMLSFNLGGSDLDIKRYWEVSYERDFENDEEHFFEKLKSTLVESVDIHTRSDVPIGGYVSGGVDSSLISIMAAEGNEDYLGFVGKFTEPDGYDESQYATTAANKGGFDLLQRDISPSDFIEFLPKIIYHLDYPVAGPGSFPQYMVSKLASEHRKVVLGGQGGDEIFGGYSRYLIAYLEQVLKGAIDGTADEEQFIVTYKSLTDSLRSLDGYQPMLAEFWSKGLFGPRDERYLDLVDRSSGIEYLEGFQKGSYDSRKTALGLFRSENVISGSYFDEMTHFDFKTLLPGLLHVEDRMSMAHGLEARVPLLDHRIVELTATVPADIKFRNGELKRLLRRGMADYLPKEILNRTDKMGFPVPLTYWFQENPNVKEFVNDQFVSSRERGVLPLVIPESNALEALPNRILWAHLLLELWFQEFHDRSNWFRSLPDNLPQRTKIPVVHMSKEK